MPQWFVRHPFRFLIGFGTALIGSFTLLGMLSGEVGTPTEVLVMFGGGLVIWSMMVVGFWWHHRRETPAP